MTASGLELPAAAKLAVPRAINLILLMLLSAVLFLTGLADLERVSLCATSIIPGALQGAFTLVVMFGLVVSGSVVVVRYTLVKWLGKGVLTARARPGSKLMSGQKTGLIPSEKGGMTVSVDSKTPR